MTYAFLNRCGLNESIATVKSYECIDIIESAYDAAQDGVPLFGIFRTATTYSQSMIWDLLENAKAALLQLCQKILSALTNLQVNNVRLVKKYQEILLERVDKLQYPIVHKTFVYPELKNYPAIIAATSIEKDIVQLRQDIQNPDVVMSVSKVGAQIDSLLRDFSRQVLGAPVAVDNLQSSVVSIVEKKARDKSILTEITRANLVDYMNQIDHYRRDKDMLTQLKRAINEDYLALKAMYTSATANSEQTIKGSLRYQMNPDKETFIAQEYNRYADIHVEMLRLFNGFITIYNTAFNTVLSILDEKITDRRNLIVQMFTVTGVLAAVNTKDVGSRLNPITTPK